MSDEGQLWLDDDWDLDDPYPEDEEEGLDLIEEDPRVCSIDDDECEACQ